MPYFPFEPQPQQVANELRRPEEGNQQPTEMSTNESPRPHSQSRRSNLCQVRPDAVTATTLLKRRSAQRKYPSTQESVFQPKLEFFGILSPYSVSSVQGLAAQPAGHRQHRQQKHSRCFSCFLLGFGYCVKKLKRRTETGLGSSTEVKPDQTSEHPAGFCADLAI